MIGDDDDDDDERFSICGSTKKQYMVSLLTNQYVITNTVFNSWSKCAMDSFIHTYIHTTCVRNIMH